ncbi:MAG: type II secretion system F family protein [Akkermansiaceae bacterium]|jgi:general secretion pathway protein F|nr:type II secretion system F family protein [Akkermansiaceae bacterium]MDP4647577.1 type II secretion system F family protein [Akkermansiaceae bacterium]MDP4720736.1 type II secretion system F family protein [Akkermansiaceae bacterium]MDP4779139.1 type II secretion system F family protein [Akkermansiaceae bacterium]MDP4847236.1 type II secretion system F family protein [Akkermansiaceae bacterium]
MPLFSYKALSTNGTVATGEIEASDRPEAMRVLDKRGLQPVNLKESSKAAPVKSANKKESTVPKRREKSSEKEDGIPDGPLKLKRAEVILFTEELSDMLGAGLQLEPALKSMENRQELGSLKAVSQRIREIVRDGVNFSVALKKVSPSFGPLYCSLAAAGEASGALDTILKRQAHYLKTLAELQSRLILAMIYPAFLILVGLGVAVVFVTTLIPQLTELIKNTPGGKIPFAIQMMMNFTDFIKAWWIVITLAVVGAGLFFKAWTDNEDNKPKWDEMQLKLPLIGAVISSRFYVQFLETMANLVGNGLPLLRALELSRDATQNHSLRSNLNSVIDQVGDGRAFSKAMIRSDSFPPLLIDMIAVGEQTGKIDQSLRRAAERFDKELDKDLQRVMALIMPAVLIMMAVLIGSFAYLMITAIFQTISNLGQ